MNPSVAIDSLISIERSVANQRRASLNPLPTQQLRVQQAKTKFTDKKDALRKLMIYHNSYIPVKKCLQKNSEGIRLLNSTQLKERMEQITKTLAQNNAQSFKNNLTTQISGNLRADFHTLYHNPWQKPV